ncbi:hypothetical protein DFP72DRAFT_904277 [Ephemerocybe angulata]|uniref:Uncharacterized protein n=1 Tax=Ephemerocybe angulata TaxID=980116 RepID=A0A8H6HTP6_9AGAR|nr:hypothetical protein DFP72DRAFT_904277 [Tulosesus angulatus]
MATVVKWMVNEIPYMKPSDYKEGMGVAWLKDYLESHAPEDDDEDAPAEGHGGDGGDGGDDDDDDDDDDEEGGPDTMNMRAGHVQVLSTIQEVDEEAITAYREAQFSTPTPSPQPQAQDEPGSTARYVVRVYFNLSDLTNTPSSVELNPLKRRRSDVDEVAPRPAPVVQQEQELEDAMDTDEEEEISMILTAAIQHDEDSEDEEEHPSKKMRMTSEIEEATSASAARAVRGSPNVAAEERKVSGTTVYSVSVDGYRSGSENPENAREQHEERNEKENKTGTSIHIRRHIHSQSVLTRDAGIASEAPVASSTHVEHAQTMYENDSNGVNSTSYLNYHEERLEAGREEQEPRTISIPPSASAFAIRESAPSPSPHLTLQDDQTQDGAQPLSRGGRALSGLPPLAPGEYRAVQSSYLDRFLGVVGVRRYSQPENQANASPSSEELTLTSALVSIGALPPQAMERAMGQTTRYGPVAQGAPEGRQTRSRTRASPGERERIAEETRARKRAEAIERGSALGVAQSAVFGSVVRPAVPANSRPLRRSNAMVVPQEAPQARPRRGASQLQRQETVASIPESASRGPRPLVRSFEHVYEVKRPLSNQQAREAKFADLETPEMSRERIRMVRTGRSPSRSPSRRSRSPRVIRMVAGVVVGETPAEEANAEAESDDDDVIRGPLDGGRRRGR